MKTVPRRIKDTYAKANQSVKFILTICDPTLRAYSDHKHMLAHWNNPHHEKKDEKIYVSIVAYRKLLRHMFDLNKISPIQF